MEMAAALSAFRFLGGSSSRPTVVEGREWENEGLAVCAAGIASREGW